MLGSARGSGRWAMAAFLGLLVVVGVLFAKPAHAQTFDYTVNSTNHPGTGVCDAAECTLDEAIYEANTNGQSDTIGFASGLSGDIELSAAAGGFIIYNNTQDLTIDGPGAGVLAIDGNDQERAFSIINGSKVTIDGLTIKNGIGDTHYGDTYAGGIYNEGGALTVSSSTISGNSSNAGGGIYNEGGTLTVSNSTISDNSAADYSGGGIYNAGGTLTVSSSTLSGNSSSSIAGGIYNEGGTLTVSNSTISGNSTANAGGGIYNDGTGTLTVSSSTISGNSADYSSGGIYNYDGTGTLANTIVAGNSATYGPDAYGTFTSQGYNLIGNAANASGWVGSDVLNPEDARLGPLQANGGPTHTHALLARSPALNAIPKGTNGCGTDIATDQRGVKRPQGGKCEIGSFEDISPRVKRVHPAHNATDIGPSANVSAFFSEAMRKGSINTKTIKLYKAGTTTAIGAQVSYDAQRKKALLNPDANLLRGKTYKAVVTTWAKDRAGNRLDQDQDPSNGNQPKVWRFTVRN